MTKQVVDCPVGGRIKHFQKNWEKLSKDQWILETIRGLKLEFAQNPPIQITTPTYHVFSKEKNELINKEIISMLEKKAICQVEHSKDGFLSPIFLVEKKGGGQRPVINLRDLNGYMVYRHFKMEGINQVKDMIQQGDWLIKVDMKDAYFPIPICNVDQKYLRFPWEGNVYQFQCLPFGITVAPWVFTKLMKVPVSYLRRMGMRLIIYLDDILVMNQTKKGALEDGKKLRDVLESLGFLINLKKSILTPVQGIEFLGFIIDSNLMTLSLPTEKMKKIKKLCQTILRSDVTTVRQLSEIIGNLTASLQAVQQAPLHYRYLQMAKNQVLKQGQNYDAQVVLSQASKEDLQWWINHLREFNGRKIAIDQNPLIIQTDASKQGWGTVCQNVKIGGYWSESEKQNHINLLELLAITYAVKSYLKQESNQTVLIQTDNKTAMTYINKMGGTVSSLCNQIVLDLWDWCLKRDISMKAEFIPGKENVIADWESRHHQDSSSWGLDPFIFQTLMNKTLACNVDLFANRLNTKLDRFYSWLPDPEAEAHNALLHPWVGIRGYAFPPFCLISQCLMKIQKERSTILLVTPAWPAQPWYATVLKMCIKNPILLPTVPHLLLSDKGEPHPLIMNNSLQLVGWVVSGDPCKQCSYQQKLRTLSVTHGERVQHLLTIQPGKSGLAGVSEGRLIPFQQL